MTAPLTIGPLKEIVVYVSDMNAQVRFYRDTLGLTIRFPAGLDDYAEQYWVEFETGECTLALHGGGERQFGKDAPEVRLRGRRRRGDSPIAPGPGRVGR